MNSFTTKVLKSSLFSSIGMAILGILLFFKSELTIISISYVIGAILVGIGVAGMLKFIINANKNVKNELDIIYGTVAVILGIIVITNPKAIASIIPFVLGIVIVISSAAKLGYGFELRKRNSDLWVGTVILSLFTLLCGVLLIFNPFAGATFITKVVGILLFIYAVLDIVSTFKIRKTFKNIDTVDKMIEQKIVEAEVIEDNTNVEMKKAKKKNKKEGE